jgi:hypothetical protein
MTTSDNEVAAGALGADSSARTTRLASKPIAKSKIVRMFTSLKFDGDRNYESTDANHGVTGCCPNKSSTGKAHSYLHIVGSLKNH